MGIELKQGTSQPTRTAAFDDDVSQASVLHMAANAKVKTTLIGQITQTSPGVITGVGGDTALSLPGGAVPAGIRYNVSKGANTAATITIGIDTTSAYFLSGAAVNLPGMLYPTTAALNLFAALAAVPLAMAHSLTGYYAETATSATGTVVSVEIDYYR